MIYIEIRSTCRVYRSKARTSYWRRQRTLDSPISPVFLCLHSFHFNRSPFFSFSVCWNAGVLCEFNVSEFSKSQLITCESRRCTAFFSSLNILILSCCSFFRSSFSWDTYALYRNVGKSLSLGQIPKRFVHWVSLFVFAIRKCYACYNAWWKFRLFLLFYWILLKYIFFLSLSLLYSLESFTRWLYVRNMVHFFHQIFAVFFHMYRL